jgi:hypothetical protein
MSNVNKTNWYLINSCSRRGRKRLRYCLRSPSEAKALRKELTHLRLIIFAFLDGNSRPIIGVNADT